MKNNNECKAKSLLDSDIFKTENRRLGKSLVGFGVAPLMNKHHVEDGEFTYHKVAENSNMMFFNDVSEDTDFNS